MYETTMTMVGRLATAVSQVTFDDGRTKATFRISGTERRFDRELQQWVDGSRLFLPVVCWRVLADRVVAALDVGDPVIVTGRLRTRAYEKDGRTHSVVEIDAASVGPDLARCSAVVARQGASSPAAELAASTSSYPQTEPVPHAAPGPSTAGPEDEIATEVATAEGAAGADADWNAGPLVREYLGHGDRVSTAEQRPDEAAVRA